MLCVYVGEADQAPQRNGQEGPKGSQDDQKGAAWGAHRLSRKRGAPVTTKRAAQVDPRPPKESPREPPKGAQEGPKRDPRRATRAHRGEPTGCHESGDSCDNRTGSPSGPKGPTQGGKGLGLGLGMGLGLELGMDLDGPERPQTFRNFRKPPRPNNKPQ